MTESSAHPGETQHLVLAHADAAYAARTSRHFRRLGFEVHQAGSPAEVHALTNDLSPLAVILDTDLAGESGWLVCDKLTRERTGPRVILVSERATAEKRRFAAFVGAGALVARQEGVTALAHEIGNANLVEAG